MGIVISLPYPNPVIDSPVVSFDVRAPGDSTVTWDVFTTAFRKIADGTQAISGSGTLTWKLIDNWGNPAARGLYYIRVKVTGVQTATKILKVLVLR